MTNTEKNKKILILTDYRSQFWLKSNYKEENFDLSLLKNEFQKYNYSVEVSEFDKIDLINIDYKHVYVIYQSSEDPDSFYKSYIEDCLLSLQLKGAILVPNFYLFRAHNNKVFMEMLRVINTENALKNPISESFGTYEEYIKKYNNCNTTKVFKLAEGAQSKNVFLLKTAKDFRRKAYKYSRSFNFYYWLVDQLKPLLKKKYPNYRKKSHNRRKFIIQNFVPGLNEDYKVLVYDKDYFVLKRGINKNDFRASGSGLLKFTKEIPEGILEYAKLCFEAFDTPFIGLDIAVKNDVFYLIEFQFVHFGNFTLEHAPFHFNYNDGNWKTIDQKVVLEEKFAESIHKFITKQ